MTDKKDLLFSKDHEWVERLSENAVRVGISAYAVEQLGDIVFVELPEEDDSVEAGAEFATVESVKSTSEIYTPVSGTVSKINDSLEDEPEKLNESPYEEGWLVEINVSGELDLSDLMDADAYQDYTDSL